MATRVSGGDSRYDVGVHMRRPHSGLMLACRVLAAWPAILPHSNPRPSPFRGGKDHFTHTGIQSVRSIVFNVERVDQLKESMDSVSYGLFTFVHLNSAPDAP